MCVWFLRDDLQDHGGGKVAVVGDGNRRMGEAGEGGAWGGLRLAGRLGTQSGCGLHEHGLVIPQCFH